MADSEIHAPISESLAARTPKKSSCWELRLQKLSANPKSVALANRLPIDFSYWQL